MSNINNGLCAGCRNKIPNKECLHCILCKQKYDLQCANVTEKRFLAMAANQKNKWKCQGCCAKQPKTDNSNTPLRSVDRYALDLSGNTANLDCSPPHGDYVTQRKRMLAACPSSSEDLNPKNSTCLTKEDIRSIIREEFFTMRTKLAHELHQQLKQLVKSELQSFRKEMSTLESSVNFLNDSYESTKAVITTYRDSIDDLQKQNARLSSTVLELQTRLQVTEQHNRSNNLEFQCIPEHRQENLISTVMQLAKVISCDLKETDIHHCTRVAKANKDDKRPRTVIVKLATPRLRDTFLANDKINTSHLGIDGNKLPIYIMEHLSPTNKKLHAAARQMAKEKGYKFVWIKQGRVFMRKTENDEHIYVRNQDALDKLK